MLECRHCGETFREDPEKIGARCVRCRLPLYDRSEALRREENLSKDAMCGKHPLSAAIGACQRCGGPYCALCRTRWREQTVCLTCAEGTLEELQKGPREMPAQTRRAVGALLLGVMAWAVAVATGFLPWLGYPFLALTLGQARDAGALMLGMVTLATLVPALFGVGQAAAAIRMRGQLLLATAGLCLCGAHLGTMVGLLILPAVR